MGEVLTAIHSVIAAVLGFVDSTAGAIIVGVGFAGVFLFMYFTRVGRGAPRGEGTARGRYSRGRYWSAAGSSTGSGSGGGGGSDGDSGDGGSSCAGGGCAGSGCGGGGCGGGGCGGGG